jgi:chromosome segregation ATPase
LVEQAMIFALGLLSMGLIVLLFLPAVWGRAMRLTLRRLEREMPLSMAEVVAERDRLRAECAVAQRRIEQRSERVMRGHAGDLAELGRRAARIATLERELATRREEIAELEAARRETREALGQTQSELGATIKDHYDLSGQLDRVRAVNESLREEIRGLNDVADQHRTTIASLNTVIEGEKAEIEEMERRIEADEQAIRHKNHELQLLANARDAALAEVAFLESRQVSLQARLETRTGRANEVEAARSAAEQERDEALAEVQARQAAINDKNETIGELEQRIAELEDKLDRAARAARTTERDLLQRIEMLRADNAVLQGKVSVRDADEGEPEDADTSVSEPDDATAEAEDETALLRRSLLEIAAEVRRLSGDGSSSLETVPRLAELRQRRERAPMRDGRAGPPAVLTDPDTPAQGEAAANS